MVLAGKDADVKPPTIMETSPSILCSELRTGPGIKMYIKSLGTSAAGISNQALPRPIIVTVGRSDSSRQSNQSDSVEMRQLFMVFPSLNSHSL